MKSRSWWRRLGCLTEKLKASGEALEAKQKTLRSPIREAQSRVQQVSAALQKPVGRTASAALEGSCAFGPGSALTARA